MDDSGLGDLKADPVEYQAKQASILLNFYRRTDVTCDLEEVLEVAREAVEDLCGFHTIWFYLVPPESDFGHLALCSGPKRAVIERYVPVLPKEADAVAREIMTGDSLTMILDARADERTNKDIVEALGSRTFLNLRTESHGGMIGVFGSGSFDDEGCVALSDTEITSFQIIAHHASEIFNLFFIREKEAALLARTEAALTESQLANAAKDRFLARMSHELRTPLNAICGFAQMIAEQRLGTIGNAQYSRYAGDIHKSGRQLLGTIKDILDTAQIAEGQVHLKAELIEVNTLMAGALAEKEGYAAAKKVEIRLGPAPRLPQVRVDTDRMVQVLSHLLDNAIKYSKSDSWIDFWSEQQGEEVALRVRDFGVGIPEQNLADIFQPFSQYTSPMVATETGAGLGLTLCKGLVELHNGRIEVNSEAGAGTTFTVFLPPEGATRPSLAREKKTAEN